MQPILNKKISRKQFVQYLGLGLLAATGISGVIKAFSSPRQQANQPTARTGYGLGTYGR